MKKNNCSARCGMHFWSLLTLLNVYILFVFCQIFHIKTWIFWDQNCQTWLRICELMATYVILVKPWLVWCLTNNMKIETLLWQKGAKKNLSYDLTSMTFKTWGILMFFILMYTACQTSSFWWHFLCDWMTFDKYFANFVTRIQCCRLSHMIYLTLKKPYKNIDTTVSLYVLAEVIVEGMYYYSIKSNLVLFYCSRHDTKVHITYKQSIC